MEQIKYKPEIDGLRAFAVLSVILYHLNPTWLPSGFIGVDIFLVISGFLITKILIKSNESNTFSLATFYTKRIKRIIPLTYTIIFLILLSGWFLSYPTVYRSESNSAISALVFLANIRFALMGNYFTSADENPLLHLWSLSLEEQFYFIWPLFIIIFYKLNIKKQLSYVIIFLILASMIFSFILSTSYQGAFQQYAYFILPTRMTGLLMGALFAIWDFKIAKKGNSLAILGLAFLLWSVLFIDKNDFPNHSILLPLLGSILIISTPQSFVTKLIFANRGTEFIGRISFSLYMWHWPLLVFSKRFLEANNTSSFYESTTYIILYFTTLLILSLLSYRFIETYFRQLTFSNKKMFLYVFCFPLFILAMSSLYITQTNGLPSRYGLTDKMTRIDTTECHGNLISDYCYLNQSGDTHMILIGDSHAGALNHFIKNMAIDQNITAYSASSGGCIPYLNNFKSTYCEAVKSRIAQTITEKSIQYIAIGLRFDTMEDIEPLFKYIDLQTSSGYKVILFKQVPKLGGDKYLNQKFMDNYLAGKINTQIDYDQIDLSYRKFDNKIETYFKENQHAFLIDLSETFCKQGQCYALDATGSPLYYDDDHLSAHGAEWAYDHFKLTASYKNLLQFIQ